MNNKLSFIVFACLLLTFSACMPRKFKTPPSNVNANSVPVSLNDSQDSTIWMNKDLNGVPASYSSSQDTTNSSDISWKTFFDDPYLSALIDSSLANNQEFNIVQQEIMISKNEIMTRKGEYLPFLNIGGATGVDKKARYTSLGASEATTDIKPGKAMPDPVPDFTLAAYASWEVDIWKKLRNAKSAATKRYLASMQGKNFLQTNLIAEIANSYYELLALDNQLDIVKQNIEIQTNALEIVKLEKLSARVTELAVKKFEALVLNTRSLQFIIQQKIVVAENRINFLVGRFPQTVERTKTSFNDVLPKSVSLGIPTQLLENRPDVIQAEFELEAAKLDVKVARANFYPSLHISSALGLQAFNPKFFIQAPESMLFSLVGDMLGPVINRFAIKSQYMNANAKQLQAIYKYDQTVLNAFIEIANQSANIDNLANSYDLKSQEVDVLNRSVEISNILFKSARADYMEVLLTQRDALESTFDLVDTKLQQLNAMVNVYRALGGGW